MFKQTNATTIESDEGYSVWMRNMSTIVYTRGSQSVSVDIEVLGRPLGAMLYTSSIRNWEPNGQKIDDLQREEIIGNIRKALQFAGYVCETY